jgi:hemolysin III
VSAVPEQFRAEERAYRREELAADCGLHIAAILAAVAGSAALLDIASDTGGRPIWPIALYCAALLLMFPCSAAYHSCRVSPRRELLRRCDHAAIFVMIAGSYTPFTIDALRGALALDMTAAIWLVALLGVAVKLACRRAIGHIDLPLYLGFGWSGFLILAAVDRETAALILVGGILYSAGALFHVWRRLRFHQAIWHAFVLAAAACQYAAVLRVAAAAQP